VKRKLGAPKSTYRHNAQIGKYCTILTSKKKIQFLPSTHVINEASLIKLRAAAGKLKSLRIQQAIKLRERIKIRQETTVLQS
jgi:hypothetical protein